MATKTKFVLDFCLASLRQNLTPDDLIDHLWINKILTGTERETCKAGKSRLERNTELLECLSRKNDNALDELIKYLEEIGGSQGHLANDLQAAKQNYVPNLKASTTEEKVKSTIPAATNLKFDIGRQAVVSIRSELTKHLGITSQWRHIKDEFNLSAADVTEINMELMRDPGAITVVITNTLYKWISRSTSGVATLEKLLEIIGRYDQPATRALTAMSGELEILSRG